VQDHPKDAEFLNKPIQHYREMMIIFGNGQATDKFAMGSNEKLGTPSDYAESSLKPEPTEILKSGKTDTMEASKSDAVVGNKRKRSMLSEDDVVLFTGMSEAIKDVVDAIRSTKVLDCHPDLYGEIMFIPGFTGEALMCAYGYLLDNKALGTSFVQWSDAHKVLWPRTHLANASTTMSEVTVWFQVDPFVQMGWQPVVVCNAGFFCVVGGSFSD
jgi:hypothetical protein